jgi:hypothetical protein
VVRVGGKGDRKGNKVVIRDLEGGCSEISKRAASSKDVVNRIACLVSWRGLGNGEVKRGRGDDRVGKKLIEGRCREVEVAKYEDQPTSANKIIKASSS